MSRGLFDMESVHLVTGGAGFIGSHLCDRLLAEGLEVVAVDDFSLGTRAHLATAAKHPSFSLMEADVSTTEGWEVVMSRMADKVPSVVWHLAANSDISAGVRDAEVDLKRTFLTTYATVQAARRWGVRAVGLASTSAVYGELDEVLDESSGPLLPVSNYGAMKLASEAVLSAAAHTDFERAWIFRFPNVIGPRSTHGVIHDFFKKLERTPGRLEVLGDGTQCKPYLHVYELVDAMWHIATHTFERANCLMIGPEGDGTTVREIAEMVVEESGLPAEIVYGQGNRGWVGDVPRFTYCIDRLKSLGWQPASSSSGAVRRAVGEIRDEILGREGRRACDGD